MKPMHKITHSKMSHILFMICILCSAAHTSTGQSKSSTTETPGIQKYNFGFSQEIAESAETSEYYILALPRIFPKGLVTPVSHQYYPIDKSNYPKYESVKTAYEEKITLLEKSDQALYRDSSVYYLNDLVLIREVLYGNRNRKTPKFDETNVGYLEKERELSRRLNLPKLELNSLTRLELMFAAKGDLRRALSYALLRVELYEKGIRTNCNSCNLTPKAYGTAAIYYYLLKEPGNAQAYYQKAKDRAKLSIDKEYAAQQLAGFYLEIKQPAAALEVINSLEKDSTLRYRAFITFKMKAIALFELKKYEDALTYNGRALEAEKLYRKNKKFSTSPYDSLFANIYIGLNQPYNALKYSNNPEVIEKIRSSAEQEKALQSQKLLSASRELEIQKIKLDNENRQIFAEAQKKDLLNRLEKTKLQTTALQQRLEQEAKIKLLDANLARQKKTKAILLTGIILSVVFLLLLFRNIQQKKHAFALLNRQSMRLSEQKDELQKVVENLNSAQTKLIQSEKLASLGELTAGIAHEIQNPLNFVNNFSEVNMELLEEMETELAAGNSAEAIEIARNIRENEKKISHHGKRADSIVKGMLQHSRATSSEKEMVDLNLLADEYLRLSYHGLRAKDKSFNAEMHTDFDVSVGKVNVIPQEFGRVLLNMFTNAFYSVSEKKKIFVRKNPEKKPGYEPIVFVKTRRKNGKIIVSIRDNGLGVPESIRNKIYQPFFTTKPTGEGTGLGLSMSYDIITKNHGGELLLTTQEGEFAEFVIIVPA